MRLDKTIKLFLAGDSFSGMNFIGFAPDLPMNNRDKR
jgi:hypothetical protein